MAAPKLVIRKGMFLIQGKVRACCSVQAIVAPEVRAVLNEHFMAEALFKRSLYSGTWPAGALAIPPALAGPVSAFLKNDACPEIAVKTILAGQLHQGANVWEMMAFEFISKIAFDNFAALVQMIGEMGTDVVYAGNGVAITNIEQFDADTKAEIEALTQPAELAA
ncbi:MAG: hypothetical protein ABL893_10880 [Hyphomicrobium sp.]|nr:hypothetical protein [Hyphomicrobium sp.]